MGSTLAMDIAADPIGGGGQSPGGAAQRRGAVGALPREVVVVAAEVPVGSGLLVDRPVQTQLLAEGPGAQVEMLVHQLRDLRAADLLGAERLDHHRHRVSHADRVGDLHLRALGKAGGDDVLGHPACSVGGGAIHLGGVLAGEGAAAVTGHPAVGVDDDLAPRQPAVAHRPADHETAGGVDEEVLQQLLLLIQLARQHGAQHVLEQVGLDQRLGVDAIGVLCGDQDLFDLHRPAVLVAHGHLRLAVGAQVGQHISFAHLRQALGELVRHRNRQRHQLFGLARGVAEHHPLIARAGDVELVLVGRVVARLIGRVHPLRDVGRLLVDRVNDGACITVKSVGGIVIADPSHGLARDVLDVDIGVGGDLPRDDDQARVDKRLTGHATVRVLGEHGVEHAV